jgi:hypothetical protein
MTRCVKRACLRGEGALDRKEWIEHRLEELAQIFGYRAKAARSRGSRLDSFVALSFALSHDFPPAQARNSRRFAAHSVKWAVGQFGTMPFVLALFYHHQLPPFGFTDDWSLPSRPTPHALRPTSHALR